MKPITNDELVSHVLRLAPSERSAEIEAAAHVDDVLAAKLDCMRRSVGIEEEPSPQSPTAVRPSRRWPNLSRPWHTLAAAVLVLVCGGGVSWAGWHFLRPQPLLQDDFVDAWGDRELWFTPRRTVREENGYLRLLDRGYLATVNDFSSPIKICLKWRWVDFSGEFLYRDSLCIALRTAGRPLEAYPHEVSDGILVRFKANNGCVTIERASDVANPIAETPLGAFKLPADVWHDITILDDGVNIQVFLRGTSHPERQGERPILTAVVPDAFPHHRIAFYNRERLASTSFESWLDDIEVWAFVP